VVRFEMSYHSRLLYVFNCVLNARKAGFGCLESESDGVKCPPSSVFVRVF
jgi:hypothetical protein